jgi:hypothetical protein
MKETRIKISSIVDNQLPQYIKEEFPLISEFLSQYYVSLENPGGPTDILQNIDQYIKVDNLLNTIEHTILTSDVSFFDSTINVSSTFGFPEHYGLILIDSEIITYTSKTSTTFEGCIRGFSGVTSHQVKDELTFTDTEIEEHSSNTKVVNLSILFLKEFLNKVKKQVTPGFEDRELYPDINERLFIKQSIDFYSSKGTDTSFKILFGALYGENVEVIRPRDYVIEASSAQYRITSDLVVEKIEGNVEDLVNSTLYQDKTDFIESAQGTVTKVEKIRRDSKDYYIISLDSDYDKDIQPVGTVFGNFTIHPKTKLVSDVEIGSTTLEVDSTVSFPNNNGNLIIDLENGTSLNITYKSKTLNQFIECTGVEQNITKSTEVKLNVYASSIDKRIKIRILGVASDVMIPNDTKLYSKNDKIKIKTLGIDLNDYKSNNWFFNVPLEYEVKSIQGPLDNSDNSYRIEVFDSHSIKVGDFVTISSVDIENPVSGYVILYNNETTFSVQLGSSQPVLNTDLNYIVKKNISKVITNNYKSVEKYTSNVQNVYYDEGEDSIYVTSPSLPTYSNIPLNINDRSIEVVFNGILSPDNQSNPNDGTTLQLKDSNNFPIRHGFFTGESIVYTPLENNTLSIDKGVYFVKKIDETRIKLSKSRSNIFNNIYVTVEGVANNTKCKFELTDFTFNNLTSQVLEPQKLIRKISSPIYDGTVYNTQPGFTGIFINGVELLNYKSKDNVYYGPIEQIIPISKGSGYDVTNPPVLNIIDPIGEGAKAYCSVNGSLERIDIVDSGFDYLEEPIIIINGGNGSGASAKANLISFDHIISFNSTEDANLVQLSPENTISFLDDHKFRDAEEVIYDTKQQTAISGLTTNSSYYVSVQNSNTIKLHKSFSDASSGINTISLLSFGSGNHIFKSKNKKKKIGSISIEDAGNNYENKLTVVAGIITSTDIIIVPNHNYYNGEIVVYNPTQTPIGGLTSSYSYIITKIDKNQFKLSEIGISSLGFSTTFYYDTKQYINLTSFGSGIHKFNYPEIKVEIKGKIGVSTVSNQDFNAKLNPIFRGEIQSVFLESGGTSYGSNEIINYNRQPLFQLSSGSGIELTPIVVDGRITNVLINSPGAGYNSSPDIKVIGDGFGAVLTPIFSNGSLTNIKIIHGGFGYNQNNTSIIVTTSGNNANFEFIIKSWKINLVDKLIKTSNIPDDDGILASGINSNYGLEYTHAYAPRRLRTLVQSIKNKDNKTFYTSDLIFSGKEIVGENIGHSPIIGWAYDGNPIYGPYGFNTPTGGSIKGLLSGYKLKENIKTDKNRPSIYPEGFFIEDYEYVGSGDLDEHNGRFCVTPEYPNGVYAYFTTIDDGNVEESGPFNNYKKPIFPYVIGNTYKSKPISFNFVPESNQDFININDTNWKRNTTPYGILNIKTKYDYILNLNSINNKFATVKNTLKGEIDSIKIIESGENYQIGDKINFDNKGEFISSASAKVSLIKNNISEVNTESISYSNTILYPHNQSFIGFTTVPHVYNNNDLITFTGIYDYKKSENIKITTNNLILTSGIGSAQYTGLVTYFNVAGNLSFPNIKENDFYKIEDEDVKILNIDSNSSRIKVLRNQNGTVGLTSYFSGTVLKEKTKKFFINLGITSYYNSKINNEFYFNPVESVGLGTTSGVGIVSTIYISNPGVGDTQITIPTQSIYLPKHNLSTGDSLIYSSNGGTSISVYDGNEYFQIQENSIVYAVSFSNDLIGISTLRVGVNSIGNFSTNNSSNKILYFTSAGVGNIHSLKTNYENELIGTVSKNVVTVNTINPHNLSLLDKVDINLNIGISTTFIVKYDDTNRRVLVNPRSFSSINTEYNTITINNHNFYTGQKILYTSGNPAIGLNNSSMYFIIVVDDNTVMLSTSYYGAIQKVPEVVNILSSTNGVISPINPPLTVIKNQPIIFDVSDVSLSYISNSEKRESSFEFKLYKDDKFTEEFNTTKNSFIFEISKEGKVGVDTTAKIVVNTNINFPDILYYKLTPLEVNSKVKKEIIIDDDVILNNKIIFKESVYNKTHTIVGISSTTFKFNVLEIEQYDTLNSELNQLEYYTNSKTAKGSIKEISITNKGRGYSLLPSIKGVVSKDGSGSTLVPESKTIGKVVSTEIQDIGFNYSSDYSIRPLVKYPDILTLEPLSTFDYIGISSFGVNYNTIPDLIVIDGFTNEVIKDVKLKYTFGSKEVTILNNTSYLSSVSPKIIPINNSNGIKIKNIVFNNSTKDVVVTLGSSFSSLSDFPFNINDRILIEGVSVGVGTTGKGYNSSIYNYSLFTITDLDPKIAGTGASLTYNLSSYLNEGEYPGNFVSFNSSGRVIPESHFPIFNPVLKKNSFIVGEEVYSITAKGSVEYWDFDNDYLKVSTTGDFEKDQNIIGKTSGSVGIIKEITKFTSDYKINSYSLVRKGWNNETGFLNNNFQRIHDSDYYQYFSYALKSKKDISVWNSPVSSLNHTSGFKKFGNLILESEQLSSGISTDQNKGDFSGVSDLSSIVSLNCFYDFDLARENNFIIDNQLNSNQIILNSNVIQDYIESIGNRVLLIDDISEQFNSNPRSTEFSVVDTFSISNYKSKKYIVSISDKQNPDISESSILTLVHNNNNGYINQYANISSNGNLGSFDFNISGTEGNLLFYPVNSSDNNYHVKLFSFTLNNFTTTPDNLSLGDSVNIKTNTITIPAGTTSGVNIVGIASTYRSAKILVQIGTNDNSYYEYEEICYIHNGIDVYKIEYGQLTTDSIEKESTAGIGTYNVHLSGSDILIDLIPYKNTEKEYIVNSFIVSFGNEFASTTDSQIISGSSINSHSVGISSSISPTSTVIASYSNLDFNSSYSIISIKDVTNSNYQISEFLTLTTENNCSFLEFGGIETNNFVGIITAGVSGSNTNIYFTPLKNIETNIKIFKCDIGLNENNDLISLNNGYINYDYGIYLGTKTDIKKQFNLTYRNNPIFVRNITANDPNIVNISDSKIKIPYHFYSTGEKVLYSYGNENTNEPIGISTTSISGIGTTDKLPQHLYIVKVDDLNIKVAASASDALKTIPNTLELTSVGIGNSHTFTSLNQNNKTLITIDNIIQSPVVSTAVTTNLVKNVTFFDSEIFVLDNKSFMGGDLIRVDDEIMKIASVGVGSTNSMDVVRPWLGTVLSNHSSSSVVYKVKGNYNIIDNTIHFSEPPFGKIPFPEISNNPDEIDYVGISTGSSFSGRIFLRNGIPNSESETYEDNYILDDISNEFDGNKKTFTLKSNGSDIVGISTNNSIVLINNVFQFPQSNLKPGNYDLNENVGITSITFTGISSSKEYDVNTSNTPRGGIILSVGSTSGFGYQPLVSAGGTAIVSAAGTIASISIGNSGFGYREGIQDTITVGVKTENLITSSIKIIGIASVVNGNVVSVAVTNPGMGYTSSNPPIVVFDDPLSYSNIPLVYSSESQLGFGTGAIVDIKIGQEYDIISFELKNLGYGYKKGDILTVSIEGPTGIQTIPSVLFSEFQIFVDSTYEDSFSAWHIGNLQVIDSIDLLFDGKRKIFPILIDGNQTTIRSKKLTSSELQSALLVFINDVLQVPNKSYIFTGGSTIQFIESPKQGDTCNIIFYKGTEDVDTKFVDILETIKVGDTLKLQSENKLFNENERIIFEIISSDTVETNLYSGPGITENEFLLRPAVWCKQTEDLFINEEAISKNRMIYEPYIQPSTNTIKNIGINTSIVFVEDIKPLFNSELEYIHDGLNERPQNKILIISQDNLVSATATSTVSTSGTVSLISIVNGGEGYTINPAVSIGNPIGITTSGIASAYSNISNGIVTSIQITNGGYGYDVENPPSILIEPPKIKYEVIDGVSYEGDFGIITGISTVSVGVASTGIQFDLFIPEDSILRDGKSVKVGIATTGISGIQTGYYFTVKNSNVGYGLTSLDLSGNVIGIGTTFIDNIYQVASVSIATTSVSGIGNTYVAKVVVNVSNYGNTTGFGFSDFYGEYSWGVISTPIRTNPQEFSSNSIVQRYNRLKYIGYSTT